MRVPRWPGFELQRRLAFLLLMAARRQPAAAASPAGLKINVKAGVGASNLSKEGHPQESGEDVSAEPGDGPTTNAGMLKRKRLTPPASPTASKRPPRGDSPNPAVANGELVETVTKKIASNFTDLNVAKHDVGKPDVVVGSEVGTEPAELGAVRVSDEGNKAIPSAQGEFPLSSAATDHQHGVSSAAQDTDTDAVQVRDQSQPEVSGLQVSSSLAASNPTASVNEEPKYHTIPTHAGWFSWTDIHTLEKRGLPEFFNGKVPGKTPEMYMKYRNTIMKKYREHFGKVITVADVQEHLDDVDEKSVHRVMEFLDHWGLINYQAPAEFLPPWKHPGPILKSDAALMLRALPRKGSSLYHCDTSCTPVIEQNLVKSKPVKTTESVIADMLALEGGAEVEYHCNFCSADCSKQRYHCQKQADFDLCPECYNEGQFGPDMVPTDFMKMDVTEAYNANGGGWSDQETLLLLEALELYGDNWNEIAEHVATKSKSQCILHFIRLPVEDPFSEDSDGFVLTNNVPVTSSVTQTDSAPQPESKEEGTAEEEPEDGTPNKESTDVAVECLDEDLVMPTNLAAFAEAGNPVMAQMAFLGTMTGSKLAGEAAKAALAALTMKDPGVYLAAGTAMILEDPVDIVKPSESENPDRSVQADESMQSGDETTSAGDAGPSSSSGVKMPPNNTTATALNNDDALTQLEPNIGKELVHKGGMTEKKLDIMEESKVAGCVKRAAASAMAAAAVKAKLLADQEEREMHRLMAVVIEHQLKKLELKLKLLNDLDSELTKQCESVERDRLNFFANQARIAASHMGTSSNSNPPTSPARQQQPAGQHHQPVGSHHQVGGQYHQPAGPHQFQHQHQHPAAMVQGPVSFQGQMVYGPGFQGMAHPPGISSNQQMQPNNAAAFMQSQLYQGLANSVHAGAAIAMQQNHFGRQMMIGGNTPPHLLQGRHVGPQEVNPPPQVVGRPLIQSDDAPGQGLRGPMPGMPGLSRPVPGGALGGMPQ